MSTPGIGPIISTGLWPRSGQAKLLNAVASFGAWLGARPSTTAQAAAQSLGRISSAAASISGHSLSRPAKVLRCVRKTGTATALALGSKRAAERLHRNKLAVALANEARSHRLECPLRKERTFDSHFEAAAHLSPLLQPSSRVKNCMERIDRRTLNLVTLMVAWHLSANELDACVLPSRPRPREPINRPDTYQRLPPAHFTCGNAAGPYIWGQKADIIRSILPTSALRQKLSIRAPLRNEPCGELSGYRL